MAQPAMIEPREFLKSGESVISSYDWTDIVEGSGKVLFYGCASRISGSTTYDLLTNQLYSSVIELSNTGETTYDFYTPTFNLPRIVAGPAYVSITLATSAASNGNATFQLKLYRNSADVSNISSAVESEIQSTIKTTLVKIPLTQTNIKKGDKLHLTVLLSDYTGGQTVYAGIDPMNRDGAVLIPSTDTDITTKFLIFIPFRIDLS